MVRCLKYEGMHVFYDKFIVRCILGGTPNEAIDLLGRTLYAFMEGEGEYPDGYLSLIMQKVRLAVTYRAVWPICTHMGELMRLLSRVVVQNIKGGGDTLMGADYLEMCYAIATDTTVDMQLRKVSAAL